MVPSAAPKTRARSVVSNDVYWWHLPVSLVYLFDEAASSEGNKVDLVETMRFYFCMTRSELRVTAGCCEGDNVHISGFDRLHGAKSVRNTF
ncbi:hypothetical protein BDD12DRAFT_458153 [Trichophaea hybrida]|nr:hypothetical protein BDD12DRAFT_458153 [Trichophaea hybrida]